MPLKKLQKLKKKKVDKKKARKDDKKQGDDKWILTFHTLEVKEILQ